MICHNRFWRLDWPFLKIQCWIEGKSPKLNGVTIYFLVFWSTNHPSSFLLMDGHEMTNFRLYRNRIMAKGQILALKLKIYFCFFMIWLTTSFNVWPIDMYSKTIYWSYSKSIAIKPIRLDNWIYAQLLNIFKDFFKLEFEDHLHTFDVCFVSIFFC